MAHVLGIDLGTTNSAMAIIEGGEPEVLTNAEGDRTTPSVVAVGKDGELITGKPAKRQAVLNPDNTVASAKRKMGTDTTFQMGGKSYTPQEISAYVLQKLKRDAESRLGESVDKAVITCPAYFSDAQRQATKDAGTIAGFEVLRIINEPTAAALAYGFKDEEEKTIMVFDLGGGTFDVSVLETGDGVFEVKATSGDNDLGGDDFDEVLVQHLAARLKQKGLDAAQDRQVLQRLREAAENAKIELSSKNVTEVSIPFIGQADGEPVHLDVELKRSEFENLCADLLERLEGPTRQALKDAGVGHGELDAVIMVGGMTRMPAVTMMAERITGLKPDLSVNPDEAVALGAAIQAGVITGDVGELLLLDVTPLTLGIETLGGRFTPLIERNTTIPTTKGRIFSTADDNQTRVDIHVLQGERPMARDNKHLGNFILDGIPPAPRGVPQIEVTFDIDVNGILNVTAEDKATSKKQSITINEANRLDDDEVERMRKEAERFAGEDEKRVARLDATNEAESAIHAAKRLLDQAGEAGGDEGLPAEIETGVNDAVEALEAELQRDEIDVETVKQRTEALQQASMKVGEHLYAKQAEAQAAAQGGSSGGAASGEGPPPGAGAGPEGGKDASFRTKKGEGDDSVDVEYEVKDDE